MKKCSIEAFSACPGHEVCGCPATFADGSECDRFNGEVAKSSRCAGWISVKDKMPEVTHWIPLPELPGKMSQPTEENTEKCYKEDA